MTFCGHTSGLPILYPLSTENDSCEVPSIWIRLSVQTLRRRKRCQPPFQQVSPSFLGATYIGIWAELDEKALPLEAQLPHLRPVEGIDLRETLGRKGSGRKCIMGNMGVGLLCLWGAERRAGVRWLGKMPFAGEFTGSLAVG